MKAMHRTDVHQYILRLYPETQREHDILARLEAYISNTLDCYFEQAHGCPHERLTIHMPDIQEGAGHHGQAVAHHLAQLEQSGGPY